MRKLILFVHLLLLLLTPVVAKTSESTQVNRAKRTIDRAVRSLESIEKQLDGGQPLPVMMLEKWSQKADKAEEFLEQASSMLEGVSEGQAERQALQSTRTRLAEVRQRLAGQRQAADQAGSLASGAEGQKAVEDYKNLSQKFRDVSMWLRSPEDDPAQTDLYQQAVQARQALDQKYASVLRVNSRETFDLQAAAREAQMTEQSLQSTINWARQNFPSLIESDLEQAREHSQSLQKTGAFSGWQTSVERFLDQANLRYQKLKSIAPNDPATAQVGAKVSSVEQSLNATKQKFRDQMVANNRMPADAYRGGDAAALKAKIKSVWAQKFPNDRILDVVIADSAWSKFSGTRWVSSSRSWNPYNYDRMKAYVKVAGSGGRNYKFFAQVVRQNLQGGKIDIFCDRPDNPEEHVHTLLP